MNFLLQQLAMVSQLKQDNSYYIEHNNSDQHSSSTLDDLSHTFLKFKQMLLLNLTIFTSIPIKRFASHEYQLFSILSFILRHTIVALAIIHFYNNMLICTNPIGCKTCSGNEGGLDSHYQQYRLAT